MNKIISKLILTYPVLQGIVSLIFNGEMLNKLFIFYMLLILLMYSYLQIQNKGFKIRKTDYLVLLLAASYIPLAFSQEFCDTNGLKIKGLIFYVYFCIYVFFALFLVSDNNFADIYYGTCCDRKFVLKISTVYSVLIIVSYVLKIGVDSDSWGTTTFSAWFDLPHGFSYELMVFLLLNSLVWVRYRKAYALVFIAFFLCIIFLTGVRTSIIAVLIIGFYYFWNLNTSSKLRAIMIAFLGILAAWKMGIFNTLIEKTLYSAANGDIGGSRLRIWHSSLSSFKSKSLFQKIFGFGYGNLLTYNLNNGMGYVHGHNDFIISLVCYGFTSFFIYIYCIFRYLKSHLNTIGAVVFVVFVASVNGYFIYAPVLGVHCITILATFYEIRIHARKDNS